MEYEYRRISELGRVVTGKTPPTENEGYYDGEFPFITPSDIHSFDEKYLTETERTISSDGAQILQGMLLPPQSICFVCIGSTIGKMCMTNKKSYSNQQINTLIPNKQNDNDYLFYLLRYIKSYFQSIGGGTGSGKGIVNKTLFSKTKLYILIEKADQKRIAKYLSDYDSLIEINNKRIKVLEQMAENLYKEWFVRFRFPGHETAEFENGLPKGWKTLPLLSWLKESFNGGWGEDEGTPNAPFVAHVIRGTDIEEVKKSKYSDIPCRFHKRKDIETKQLHENDIILELSNGNINNIGRTLFVGKDILSHFEYVMCASFCKTLRFENRYIAFYVWKYIEYLQNSGLMFFYKNTGSNGINNFNFKKFLRMPITIPNDFSYIEPLVDYYKQASNIREMNYDLVQQRDLLLPRLMSGKLEV